MSSTRLVKASLLVLFTYVFLANAWTGDDAHITFRTVWNFLHGYGLTYNPDERVQAYTDPLWMLAITAAHLLTGEFIFTVTALSWLFNVAAGILLIRRLPHLATAVLMVGWVLSSKALVDYTSSGLEYPLAYFLIAAFYVPYLRRDSAAPATPRELRFFVAIAALAFVTRIDMVLLFVAPVAELAWRSFRAPRQATLRAVVAGASPAVAWVLFATFYYGFPLPNTYYAKVANGVPSWLQHQQGWAYLFNSIGHDPITLGTVALALLAALTTRGATRRAAASALLYVAYTVSVGGDFMSGRFFAMPFLVAAITVVPLIEVSLTPWFGGALILYNLIVPIVPIKTTGSYDGAWPWRSQNGIKDERGHSHQASNILKFSPFHPLPDTTFGREGTSFAAGDAHAAVYCCVGQFGLNAGPGKHVIDENALSDPLLARLPVSPRLYFDFWTSHYFRDLPEGYVQSVETRQNLLTDPQLRDFYEKIRHVTRGPLFSTARLRDIVSLNVAYRSFHEEYGKRQPVALSIPANHDRFGTDVGQRDGNGLRSTGAPGYLQSGPGIPLRAGFYRARWIGSVSNGGDGRLGFVEIWSDGVRLDRQPVQLRGPATPHQRLAQVDFTLAAAVHAIEYRFYVARGIALTLERAELYSGLAIPPDGGP